MGRRMISIGDTTISGNYKKTYSIAFKDYVPPATPTYIFSLRGNTRAVRILRIGISATQTTGGIINIQLDKLSSALTGGTALPGVVVLYDSNQGSSSLAAVPRVYTANTTGGGTLVGLIKNVKLTVSTAGIQADAEQNEYIFDFTHNSEQDLTLRSINEGIGLTLLGTTLTGGSICLWAEWTEE